MNKNQCNYGFHHLEDRHQHRMCLDCKLPGPGSDDQPNGELTVKEA